MIFVFWFIVFLETVGLYYVVHVGDPVSLSRKVREQGFKG